MLLKPSLTVCLSSIIPSSFSLLLHTGLTIIDTGDRHRAQENAQATYDSIKASANSATDLGKHKLEEAQAKIDAERKKAQAEIQKTIDDADRKVQDQAAKAKGWFSK